MPDQPPAMNATEADACSFSLILDIRPHARSTPTLPRALPAPTDDLLDNPARFIEKMEDLVLIVCDIGLRSGVVADQLRVLGYGGAVSLHGGIEAWTATGLPTVSPEGLSADSFSRYDRQIKLPGLGVSGQRALGAARVTVVGAGGLGSPVLAYLAGAGVGHLTIIDSDIVEVSNLHRQPMYCTDNIGAPKARVAAAFVTALNPTIDVAVNSVRLDSTNAVDLLTGCEIVVACSDNLETTRAINVAAILSGVPMVFGSVYRFEGQIAILDASKGPCYECVFPDRAGITALNCSIVGVLGPVTGVVGALQATEVIKLITGVAEPSIGVLGLYDARSQSLDSVTIRKNLACTVCSAPAT